MTWQLRKLDHAKIVQLDLTPPDGALALYSLTRTMPDGQRMGTMLWVGENRSSAALAMMEMRKAIRRESDASWMAEGGDHEA